MTILNRYPLLTRLLLTQLSVISVGLVVLLSVYQFTEHAQLASSMSHLKEQMSPVLAARQEQWRAWKYLGLDTAITEETEQIRKQFPLKSIRIVREAELPKTLSMNELVFPEENLRSDDFVVYVTINSHQAEAASQAKYTVLLVLGAVSLCFLGIVLFSGRYIYRSIYLPMLTLNQILSRRDSGDRTDLRSVPAVGEMRDFIKTLDEMLTKTQDYERQAAVLEVASQVSHDIQSPLTALNVVVQDLGGVSEERRIMIRSAISRIRDITNNLVSSNTESAQAAQGSLPSSHEPTRNLLSSLVDALVSEKRLQFRSNPDIEITFELRPESYGVFADVHPVEFKRILSNLINNSVESIKKTGHVDIRVRRKDGFVELEVVDNGKGIHQDIIKRLGVRGETYGKPGGSGLGLYHAKKMIEAWNGKLEIRSTVNVGTTVIIKLPDVTAPKWFVQQLDIPSPSRVVILDDDTSIHQIWNNVLGDAPLDIIHFSSGDKFEAWLEQEGQCSGPTLFLVDFELLSEKASGLDLIERYDLAKQSILVTNRFEESGIMERCLRRGIRMIPKGMVGFIPVAVTSCDLLELDAVLIDDDSLIHSVWNFEAKAKGHKLQTFSSSEEFWAVAHKISRHTPIFVDVNLGNGIRGDSISKDIHAKGFSKIYLTTGYQSSEFTRLPWIAGVRGKEMPSDLAKC